MKRTIISLGLFLTIGIIITSCGEDGNKNEEVLTEVQVPAAVKEAFMAKYPGATEVAYEKETDDGKVEYEIEFKLDGKNKEAFFDEAGNFIKE